MSETVDYGNTNIFSNTGNQNNIRKQLNQKQKSIMDFLFHRLTVV